MTELTETLPRKRPFRMLRDNPVTLKELRSRMRGRRAFVVLTVYLVVMSLLIALIYLAYASAANQAYGPDPRQAGKVVFGAVIGVQVFLVTFIAPAFTAGAITGEKERQTFDLLRTTLLPANWFVIGKLLSSLSYVFLLIIAAIPLQSIAFLLGGLSVEELVISQILIVIGAITFAMYGLFCSAHLRSTLAASVTTFGGAIFWTLGMPILVFMFTGFIGPIFFSTSAISWAGEAALALGALLLGSTNLPASLIVSEVFLLEENTLFFYKENFSGHQVWLFSPWMLTIPLYLLAAWILYRLTIRKVRKIAEK
ncbi:MAG: ABC transporter permease subunit [Chloroflexota bacterium]|nr:ABC transporter permease subunit [Ardenticatenaceae bacterium]